MKKIAKKADEKPPESDGFYTRTGDTEMMLETLKQIGKKARRSKKYRTKLLMEIGVIDKNGNTISRSL